MVCDGHEHIRAGTYECRTPTDRPMHDAVTATFIWRKKINIQKKNTRHTYILANSAQRTRTTKAIRLNRTMCAVYSSSSSLDLYALLIIIYLLLHDIHVFNNVLHVQRLWEFGVFLSFGRNKNKEKKNRSTTLSVLSLRFKTFVGFWWNGLIFVNCVEILRFGESSRTDSHTLTHAQIVNKPKTKTKKRNQNEVTTRTAHEPEESEINRSQRDQYH